MESEQDRVSNTEAISGSTNQARMLFFALILILADLLSGLQICCIGNSFELQLVYKTLRQRGHACLKS